MEKLPEFMTDEVGATIHVFVTDDVAGFGVSEDGLEVEIRQQVMTANDLRQVADYFADLADMMDDTTTGASIEEDYMDATLWTMFDAQEALDPAVTLAYEDGPIFFEEDEDDDAEFARTDAFIAEMAALEDGEEDLIFGPAAPSCVTPYRGAAGPAITPYRGGCGYDVGG